MYQTVYRDVTVTITPGRIGSECGTILLTWPGCEAEIRSQWRQESRILEEAKAFVDDWIAKGFIRLPSPTAQEENATQP